MDRVQAPIAVALMAALLAPSPLLAAPSAPADWQRLRAVKTGHKVSVHLDDGSVVKGSLAAADETGLTVRADGHAHTIPRERVREVRHARRSAGRKIAGLLVGAATGAFGGLYLGGTIGQASCEGYCEDAGLFGALWGFLIGGVLGAISGITLAARGEGGVIYRAR
jgi:ferric-dicitrate binding protein FerR (iron transport regulator)